MYGEGLVKGLKLTIQHFFNRKITEEYPEVMPNLPPRSHGSFVLYPEKCIACGICANACPNGVIKVDSYKNAEGKRKLDKYSMSLGYCLYCGLCVESCPTDAIVFDTNFELACYSREDTIYTWNGIAEEISGSTNAEEPAVAPQE